MSDQLIVSARRDASHGHGSTHGHSTHGIGPVHGLGPVHGDDVPEPATRPAVGDHRLEYLARGEDAELVLARAGLARRQHALLAALVAGGPVPAGFDPRQVRAQAIGLAAKRRDTVARVCPELPRVVGPSFGPLFLRYAQQHPQSGGYRADARAFARWALTAPHRPERHPELVTEPVTEPADEPGDALGTAQRRALEQWLTPPPAQAEGSLSRLRRALPRALRPSHH
ncbi:hypothetical protein [Kitasatospora sp. NPDC050543]|uniref:hypothetical protein n=1 Tax=Kitasatospora sp. NPDC050543 TaxID=3364054 RepID=UPI00379E897E